MQVNNNTILQKFKGYYKLSKLFIKIMIIFINLIREKGLNTDNLCLTDWLSIICPVIFCGSNITFFFWIIYCLFIFFCFVFYSFFMDVEYKYKKFQDDGFWNKIFCPVLVLLVPGNLQGQILLINENYVCE